MHESATFLFIKNLKERYNINYMQGDPTDLVDPIFIRPHLFKIHQ